jgi:phage portal protein BeeE
MPNDDAQWLETRRHQVLEMARVLRLPPYKLGVNEPGAVSFKSVEQFALDFVVDSVMPWVTRWEQDLGMQLLGDDWTGAGGEYFVTFVLDGLLRGDTSSATSPTTPRSATAG